MPLPSGLRPEVREVWVMKPSIARQPPRGTAAWTIPTSAAVEVALGSKSSTVTSARAAPRMSCDWALMTEDEMTSTRRLPSAGLPSSSSCAPAAAQPGASAKLPGGRLHVVSCVRVLK